MIPALRIMGRECWKHYEFNGFQASWGAGVLFWPMYDFFRHLHGSAYEMHEFSMLYVNVIAEA